MFQKLRDSRSLLMGLAICGVVFFHTPMVLHDPWVSLLHDMLNCGVDMFLFLSGLGPVTPSPAGVAGIICASAASASCRACTCF